MDEYIRLDTTIIGIDNLISKASTAEEANALFKAKDVIYSQQRCLTDVQPVKHGRWISTEELYYNGMTKCSCCNEEYYIEDIQNLQGDLRVVNYCPNCGARMRMDGDSEMAERKTNRQKYFLQRDEYDLMMTIAENIKGIGTFCPIKAIGGKRPPCKHDTQSFLMMRDCRNCIQRWLNEEADG